MKLSSCCSALVKPICSFCGSVRINSDTGTCQQCKEYKGLAFACTDCWSEYSKEDLESIHAE